MATVRAPHHYQSLKDTHRSLDEQRAGQAPLNGPTRPEFNPGVAGAEFESEATYTIGEDDYSEQKQKNHGMIDSHEKLWRERAADNKELVKMNAAIMQAERQAKTPAAGPLQRDAAKAAPVPERNVNAEYATRESQRMGSNDSILTMGLDLLEETSRSARDIVSDVAGPSQEAQPEQAPAQEAAAQEPSREKATSDLEAWLKEDQERARNQGREM